MAWGGMCEIGQILINTLHHRYTCYYMYTGTYTTDTEEHIAKVHTSMNELIV